MKQLILLFALSITKICLGQTIDTLSIQSKVFDEKRDIYIYLPEQYSTQTEKKYEVVYVFDSQARQYFDLVHSTIQFVNNGIPVIVIGIVSNFSEEKKQNRNSDFLPKPVYEETTKKYGGYLGNADKFLDFFQNEVVKFIDNKYRTFPYRIGIAHSNGASFLSYCFLKSPEIFNSYLLVSPNYEYDKEQFVGEFQKFNPELLKDNKFVFMCNSNEDENWAKARNKIIPLFETNNFSKKIKFINRDYSQTENHGTVFPIGTFYGLKDFFNYKYLTAENVINYNDELESKKLLKLDSDYVNQLAYTCFWNDKPHEAIKIIQWAILKFPNESNLFDSQGEFLEKISDIKGAKKSYENALKAIESQKSKLDKKTYEEKYSYYKGNLDRLKN